MFNKTRQKGAALLTALLVTALAAVIATAIIASQRMLIDQSQLLINSDRLYLALQGVQDWAISEILDSTVNGYSPGIVKTSVFPKTTLDGGVQVAGFLMDQQGLFNLNALQQTQYEPNFLQLLSATNQSGDANKIVNDVVGWLTPLNQNDEAYLLLHPPYRPGHRAMANPSELRAVLSVDQKTYLKLLPDVTALPTTNFHININTAPVPVIQSADPTMSSGMAESLASCRSEAGAVQTAQQFQACLTGAGVSSQAQGVLIDTSDYFLVVGYAKIGKQQMMINSLLKVVRVNNAVKVDILWQSIN